MVSVDVTAYLYFFLYSETWSLRPDLPTEDVLVKDEVSGEVSVHEVFGEAFSPDVRAQTFLRPTSVTTFSPLWTTVSSMLKIFIGLFKRFNLAHTASNLAK